MVGASGAVSLCSFYVLRFVHTPGLVPVRVFLSSFLFRLMSDFALSSLSSFTLIISLSSVLLDYRTAALSNVPFWLSWGYGLFRPRACPSSSDEPRSAAWLTLLKTFQIL